MGTIRLISRLDIKGPNLIKGVQLEGLRVVGDPNEYVRRYYTEGIDEIIFMDAVASLYGRNSLKDIIRATAANIFVPMTVGGGIRSVKDVQEVLRSGADKVAVNTAAVLRPELITEIAQELGSQCMVLSVEAKRTPQGGWEALMDNGREHSHLDAVEWVRRGVDLGAGEILLTSVDREGTGKGFDLELIEAVSKAVSVPVIASGGLGSAGHAADAVDAGADAVAMAGGLHYQRVTLGEVREQLRAAGQDVRDPDKD